MANLIKRIIQLDQVTKSKVPENYSQQTEAEKKKKEHNRRTQLRALTHIKTKELPQIELNATYNDLDNFLTKVEKTLPRSATMTRYQYEQSMVNVERGKWVGYLHDTVNHIEHFVLAMTDQSGRSDKHHSDRNRLNDHNINVYLSNLLPPPPVDIMRANNLETQYTVHLRYELLRLKALKQGKASSSWCTGAIVKNAIYYSTVGGIMFAGQMVLSTDTTRLKGVIGESGAAMVSSWIMEYPQVATYLKTSILSLAFDIANVGALVVNAPFVPAAKTVKGISRLALRQASIIIPIMYLNPATGFVMAILARATINIGMGAVEYGVDLVIDKFLVYEPTGEELEMQVIVRESQAVLQREITWNNFMKTTLAENKQRKNDLDLEKRLPTWFKFKMMFRRAIELFQSKVVSMKWIKEKVLNQAGAMACLVVGMGITTYLQSGSGDGGSILELLIKSFSIETLMENAANALLMSKITPWFVNHLAWMLKMTIFSTMNVFGIVKGVKWANKKAETMASRLVGRQLIWGETVATIASFMYEQLTLATTGEVNQYVKVHQIIKVIDTQTYIHAPRAIWAIAANARDMDTFIKLLDWNYIAPAMVKEMDPIQAGDFLYATKKSERASYQKLPNGNLLDLSGNNKEVASKGLSQEFFVDLSLRTLEPVTAETIRPDDHLVHVHTGMHVEYNISGSGGGGNIPDEDISNYKRVTDPLYVFGKSLRVPAFSSDILNDLNFEPDQITKLGKSINSPLYGKEVMASLKKLANVHYKTEEAIKKAEAARAEAERNAQADHDTIMKQRGDMFPTGMVFNPAAADIGTDMGLQNTLQVSKTPNPLKFRATINYISKVSDPFVRAQLQGKFTEFEKSWHAYEARRPHFLDSATGESGKYAKLKFNDVKDEATRLRSDYGTFKKSVTNMYSAINTYRQESIKKTTVAAEKEIARARKESADAKTKILNIIDKIEDKALFGRNIRTSRQNAQQQQQPADPVNTITSDQAFMEIDAVIGSASTAGEGTRDRLGEHTKSFRTEMDSTLREDIRTGPQQQQQTTQEQKQAQKQEQKQEQKQSQKQSQKQQLDQRRNVIQQKLQQSLQDMQIHALDMKQTQDVKLLQTMASMFENGQGDDISEADLNSLEQAVTNHSPNIDGMYQQETLQEKSLAECNAIIDNTFLDPADYRLKFKDSNAFLTEADKTACFFEPMGVYAFTLMQSATTTSAMFASSLFTGGLAGLFVKSLIGGSFTLFASLVTMAAADITTKCERVRKGTCEKITQENQCSNTDGCGWKGGTNCAATYSEPTCILARMLSTIMCNSTAMKPYMTFMPGCVGTPSMDMRVTSKELLSIGMAAGVDIDIIQNVWNLRSDKSPSENDLKKYAELVGKLLNNPATSEFASTFLFGNQYSGIRPEWNRFLSYCLHEKVSLTSTLWDVCTEFLGEMSTHLYAGAGLTWELTKVGASWAVYGAPSLILNAGNVAIQGTVYVAAETLNLGVAAVIGTKDFIADTATNAMAYMKEEFLPFFTDPFKYFSSPPSPPSVTVIPEVDPFLKVIDKGTDPGKNTIDPASGGVLAQARKLLGDWTFF